jgi:hypothetical protein
MRPSLVLLTLTVVGCGAADPSDPDDEYHYVDAAEIPPRWRLEDRATLTIDRHDPAALNAARVTRLQLYVEHGACEEPAMIDVDVDPELRRVTLTPRVWAPVGVACAEPPERLWRPVILELTAATWTIVSGAAPALVIHVGPAAAGCDAARTPCAADCDCAAGERCLGYLGLIGPTTACARPCELDRDCGGETCEVFLSDAVNHACGGDRECGDRDDERCPDGWSCADGTCAPAFELAKERAVCVGDADCAPGLRCVEPWDGGEPRCQATCLTGGPWCEGAHRCGALDEDASGLAGTDSVCVAAEE